jgi:ribosome-associated protein
MIDVAPGISLDESELLFEFVRASGPGGQNVNKVATAVQLRFDIRNSPALPEPVRERLLSTCRGRISKDGILLISASRHRTQERNRRDAVDRLISFIRDAARPRKQRRPTRPTRASKEVRMQEKRHRARLKRSRGPVRDEDQ